MQQITDRQREIKELLEEGLSAVEIAKKLEVSRNAVYQQIQRMRHNGALDPDYTPTGQPVREMRVPGADLLQRLTSSNGDGADELAQAGALALAHELRRVRSELDAIVRRLALIVPR